MSPESDAQLREILRLWKIQKRLRGQRATKSKAYQDVLSQIRQATDAFRAMIASEKE